MSYTNKRQKYGKKAVSEPTRAFLSSIQQSSQNRSHSFQAEVDSISNDNANNARDKVSFKLPTTATTATKKRRASDFSQNPKPRVQKRHKTVSPLSDRFPASRHKKSHQLLASPIEESSDTLTTMEPSKTVSSASPPKTALPTPPLSSEASTPPPDTMTSRLLPFPDNTSSDTSEATGEDPSILQPHTKTSISECSPISVLSRELIAAILQEALPIKSHGIWPLYCKGMVADGMFKGFEEDLERVVDNVSLSLFRVCKEFHDIGSALHYSQTGFRFNDPEACSWWMKRIGKHNVAQIRSLELSMGTGHLNIHDGVPVLLNGAPIEAKWLAVFTRYIKHAEQLSYLHIELFNWKKWRTWETNPWTLRIFACRSQLFDHLRFDVRGIREVHITNRSTIDDRFHFNKAYLSQLALLMQQHKSTRAPPQPNKLLPLRESLAEIAQEMAQESLGG